jgi:hypothetical protein
MNHVYAHDIRMMQGGRYKAFGIAYMSPALWEELQQDLDLTDDDRRYCFGKKNTAVKQEARETEQAGKVAAAELAVAQTKLITAACNNEAERCLQDKSAKGMEQSHATFMALLPAIVAAKMPTPAPAPAPPSRHWHGRH